MKIYQLENGNIEVVTRITRDGRRIGFVIVMDEGQAAFYCKTECSKQVFEATQDIYAYEVEHG